MHRLRTITLLIMLLLLPSALAALPPHFQRLAELNAILNSEVVSIFGIGRPIEVLEYVGVDLYRVAAGDCEMLVHIVGRPLPEGFVGARQFDVELGELTCS